MYHSHKAAQVAGYLLNKAGGIEYSDTVIKLMYIAERRFLNEKGRTIINDSYYSMDNGPVLSNTYNLIKNSAASILSADDWRSWITPQPDHKIGLAKVVEDNYDFDELSRSEMAMLDQVFEEFGHYDRWVLCDKIHEFGEWRNPHGSSRPIDLREMLTAQGRDEDEAETMIADIIAQKQIDELLADLCERA